MPRPRQPARPCAVAACDRPAHTRGLCTLDYASWWRGNPLGPLREGSRDYVAERKAFARAQERPLSEDLTRWDATRHRSRKTRRARRMGLWGVGPSDMSQCRKKIEYRERPPAGFTPLPEDKRKAAAGVLMHEAMSAVTRELYPWRRVRVPVMVPGLDVPGEADSVDELADRVDDWKSCDDYTWRRIGEHGAREHDIDQALLYALGLRAAGIMIETVRVIYVHRSTLETEQFEEPYDEARALRAVGYLHAIVDALDAGIALPRDRSGPTTDPLCNICFARRHCWDMTAAEAAGRSPEGWMEARDDAGVEWALTEHYQAHQAQRPHADIKERMKVLLQGVQQGTYGDMVLSRSTGKTEWVPDHEARVEQVEAFLADGGDPGEIASLPYPQRERVVSTSRISIRPVRAAQRKGKK